MTFRVIKGPADILRLFAVLKDLKLPITVSWVQGEDRTKAQNRLQWLWANEVAMQRGDCDAADVQAEWKLHHGVPILRAENDAFREDYDKNIKPLPYEIKIAIMRGGYEVSSILKVPQMARYMNTIDQECAERGFTLTLPDPELAAHHQKYRETPGHDEGMTG